MTLYLHTHTDTCARLSFMGKYGCGSREKNALSGFFKMRKNIIVYAICLRRTRKKKNERRAYATNEKYFFFLINWYNSIYSANVKLCEHTPFILYQRKTLYTVTRGTNAVAFYRLFVIVFLKQSDFTYFNAIRTHFFFKTFFSLVAI